MGIPLGVRTRRSGAAGVLAAFLGLLAAPAATAQDDVRKEIEELRRRVQELEGKAKAGGDAAPADGLDARIEEYLKKGVPSKKGSPIKFYGYLRLDLIRDDSTPSNTQTIQWVLSEDPTAAGRADKDDADFTIHARLTRLGLDFDGGKVASLGDPKLTGKLEIDFYNNGLAGQAESRSALRMRHAWLQLDGGEGALLAGQSSDLVSPYFPVVNPDMGNWNAGNLGDRRPQVKYTQSIKTSTVHEKNKLTLAGMIGLTGAVDNQNLDGAAPTSDPLRDGEASGYPMGQVRTAMSFATGKTQSEVGLWGHYGRESTEAKFAGEDRWESTSVGVDVLLPFSDIFTLKGEIWKGRNLDDLRGGIGQGVNTTTGNEVHSQGGWIEVQAQVSKPILLGAGFSEDNPDDSDIGAGGREKNRVAYFALHFNFDPVEFGIDFMNWHTAFKGIRGGVDNRVQAYIAYNF